MSAAVAEDWQPQDMMYFICKVSVADMCWLFEGRYCVILLLLHVAVLAAVAEEWRLVEYDVLG
jgi:hypothetical protein